MKFCIAAIILILAITTTMSAPQWNPTYQYTYTTHSPYSYGLPTFSPSYAYTTAYPYTTRYSQSQYKVRIWPYVVGQYYPWYSSMYGNTNMRGYTKK